MTAPAIPDPRAPSTARTLATRWRRVFALSMTVAAVLAASGAFGAGGPDLIPRLVYWLALVAAGCAIGVALGHFFIPATWSTRRPWLAWAVISLAIWPPMTAMVAAVNALAGHRPFGLPLILASAPDTLVVTAGLSALAFLARRQETVETHAADPGAAPARFLARLPAKLAGAELWAVEAEDHDLRLHTSAGQDLILMRLADAVAELDGVEGARTHRSWWVAKAAVRGVRREDGRALLDLPAGLVAPVSRAHARVLRDAGWF